MTTVLCVGKNYAKHAAELGDKPGSPIWFFKPKAAIIHDGQTVRLPPVGRVDHEVEMALRIGADGQPDAMTVAIDVTARDLQRQAKDAGRPWARAKGYDTFLPLGAWVPLAPDVDDVELVLSINGEVRQHGSTADMTWSVAQLLAEASAWTTLAAGDILLTGTPEGVGPLSSGDVVDAELVGHVSLQVRVD